MALKLIYFLSPRILMEKRKLIYLRKMENYILKLKKKREL